MAGLNAQNASSGESLLLTSGLSVLNMFLAQRVLAIAMSSSWFGDTIVTYSEKKKKKLNPSDLK